MQISASNLVALAGAVVVALPVAGQSAKKSRGADLNKAEVGLLTVSGTPAERPGPFDWLSGDSTLTLRSLVGGLHEAAADDNLRAVVIKLDDAALGATHVEELADAIGDAQDAGKKVYVVADSYNTTSLMLGAVADESVIHHGSPVSLPGLYMEQYYLADMFNWIGAEASFEQVGKYKGADETYTRSEPSDAWDSNITQLLDSMYGNIRSILKDGNSMSDAELDRAMEEAFYTTAEKSVELGLIDTAVDLGHLEEMLEEDLGADISWNTDLIDSGDGMTIDPSNPFAMLSMLSRDPSNNPVRPTIAVVHIDGVIMDGDSTEGGLFGSSSVGSRTIRGIMKDLEEDDDVKGVVIRINSPGGSATASEVIYRAARDVAEEKPVYVSVGNMAASGGYYIAVAGDKIFVNPSSIVGSIGVVGGKVATAGVFDKLHINVVGRGRGPHAELFGSSKPWDAQQRKAVRDMMTSTYDLFTSRVEAGRDGIDLSETAEGRLFTGNVGLELNMADEVGTLTDTIEAMAEELDMERYDVLDYPGPMSFDDLLESFTGGMVASPVDGMEQILQRVVGPPGWPSVKQRIDAAVMLNGQPVMLIDPAVIVVK
ncbi:MAG: signal peptide peptidase SppA [Phycisphaerales bacterium]